MSKRNSSVTSQAFGANAAGPIVLGVKNNSTGTVLRTVDTSNASAGLPALAAPPVTGDLIAWLDGVVGK